MSVLKKAEAKARDVVLGKDHRDEKALAEEIKTQQGGGK